MCYPPPGPRCSHHANIAWLTAVSAMEEETNPNRRILLQQKVDETLRAFYSTPRGQNRLLREIGALSTKPESSDELARLSLALKDGALTRKSQIAAYKASIYNGETAVKAALKTTRPANKQEYAVAIVFNALLAMENDKKLTSKHILPNNIVACDDKQIICLPQKSQLPLGIAKTHESNVLASENFPPQIAQILTSSSINAASQLPPTSEALFKEWLVAYYTSQDIEMFAAVDTRTEKIMILPIQELFDHYTLEVKLRKKLGGTSSYTQGATDVLRDELQSHELHQSKIVLIKTSSGNKTYLLDTPALEPSESHTKSFFFAENFTKNRERYHEVRVRHQSSQFNVFAVLRRKTAYIAESDTIMLEKVLKGEENV